jgi:hypothetical protein
MSRRPAVLLIAVALAGLALTGCDPLPPAPSGTPSSSGSAEPASETSAPSDALAELPDDAVLGISAVVTDASGASLRLTAVVHRSVAWDSPEGTPLAALMTSGCLGALDESVYADQLWSFAQVDVTAAPLTGTWTAGTEVAVHPSTDFLSLASDGALVELPGKAAEAPHCDRSRALSGAGEGRLVVGFQGDTDAVGAAGHFTRWANHRYGFATLASGTTLSDCVVVVTELGTSLGGGAPTWSTLDDGSTCTVGTSLPEDTDS